MANSKADTVDAERSGRKHKKTAIPADNCDSLYTSQSLSLPAVRGDEGQGG